MKKSPLLSQSQDVSVSINKRDSQTYRVTKVDEEAFEMIAHSFKDSKEAISIIIRPLPMPCSEKKVVAKDTKYSTDINGPKNWTETAQWIIANFLRMPDENKRAVLDKIAPADKAINHFIEFMKDDYGIELPDMAVQEYLKWKTDQTPWMSW